MVTCKKYLLAGGCSRSGTTMLASILGASPECVAPPETDFLIPLAKAIQAGTVPPTVDAMRDFISGHWRFRFWNVEIEDRPLAVERPDDPWSVYRAVIFDAVDCYARAQGEPDWRVWVDHRPGNIRWVRFLVETFPDAGVLHIVRDGRAVACSAIPLDWGPNEILSAADFWISRMARGLAAEAAFPGAVHRVRYEDILAEPEVELRRLCAATDISFSCDMLENPWTDVPSYTKNQHRQVGSQVNRAQAELWRQRLTPHQVELFESKAAWLLGELGYECVTGMASRGPTLGERFLAWLWGDVICVPLNKCLRKIRRQRALGLHKARISPGKLAKT